MFLFLIVFLLAIPTYGVSVIAYIVWLLFKNKGPKPKTYGSSRPTPPQYTNVERAIMLLAKEHDGSVIGTSVEGIKYNEILSELLHKSLLNNGTIRHLGSNTEASIAIASQRYDIVLSCEPNSRDGSILRVRTSQPWLEELWTWMVEEANCDNGVSKYYLLHTNSLIIGSATMPEWRPDKTVDVPASIGYLTNLETLGLINRNIGSLPNSLRNLKSLKELKLGGNQLKIIPPAVFTLIALEILTLWSNDIEDIPSEIGRLRNLKGLDLSHNCFTKLPSTIVNLTKLEKFYMLTDIDVELSHSQKIWLIELIRAGADVILNKSVDENLLIEFPELAQIQRFKENFEFSEYDQEDSANADSTLN